MDPGEKGWLKKLIAFHKRQMRRSGYEYLVEKIQQAPDVHHYLYELIQPTGLMYGYPINFIVDAPRGAADWSEKDKIKVIWAEGFLFCGLFFHYHPENDLTQAFSNILEDMVNFYQENFNLYINPPRNIFGRKKNLIEKVEYLLDKRINIKTDWRNFWTGFFHNSMLFFDLIFFMQWMDSRDDIIRQTMAQRRQDLRLDLLKVIAAAAHADAKIFPEEKELFNYFLQSAQLPAPKKKKAEQFLKNGIELNELDLDLVDAWIFQKYFLELAILTVWANREISEMERIFLRKLAHQLDLIENDLQLSMNAVEAFVMEYWQRVHYLQLKQNYRIVSEKLLRRVRTVVRTNQRAIAKEIQQSRELMTLLRRYTYEELSQEEKEKMRTQLLDILKAIPAFAYLFLPGSFFTLPILLRIIPKQILYPSSYREDLLELEEE